MVVVSVVIPSKDRWDTLAAAVASVRAQTGLDANVEVEIIVVNDGSSDPRYYTKRLDATVIHLHKNSREMLGYKCCAFVRNCGIRISRGRYVCFLDDDDAWYPQKLAVQLEAMRRHKAKASCTDAVMGHGTYPRGRKVAVYNREFYRAHHGTLGPWIDHKRLLESNPLITSGVMLDRQVFGAAGLFDETREMDKGGVYEDYELWKRVANNAAAPFLWIDEPLVWYDAHHGGGRK